jgi:hypothetical protein
MEKANIQAFIDKYHLGGAVESVTWNSTEDAGVSVKFVTPTKDCAGSVETTKDFALGANDISIYSTSQLNKLLTIMDGFMTIDVVKGNQDIPYQLNIKNQSFDLNFHLSSEDLIPNVPEINEPEEYGIELDIDEDFIRDFTRAHTAIDKPNRVEINCKVQDEEKFIEFKIGESATHANKVSLLTPASFVIGTNGLPFSANTIREVLLANKTATSGKIYINEEGLMKILFNQDEITSTYFLIRLSE